MTGGLRQVAEAYDFYGEELWNAAKQETRSPPPSLAAPRQLSVASAVIVVVLQVLVVSGAFEIAFVVAVVEVVAVSFIQD